MSDYNPYVEGESRDPDPLVEAVPLPRKIASIGAAPGRSESSFGSASPFNPRTPLVPKRGEGNGSNGDVHLEFATPSKEIFEESEAPHMPVAYSEKSVFYPDAQQTCQTPRSRMDVEQLENATSDEGLKGMLPMSNWLQGRKYTLPRLLDDTPDVMGMPRFITAARRAELLDGYNAKAVNANEKRFVRNREVIRQIARELKVPYPTSRQLVAKIPGTGSANPLKADAPMFVPKGALPAMPSPDDTHQTTAVTERAHVPTHAHQQPAQNSRRSDQEEAEILKKTVLKPFYDRIYTDSEEIVRLRQEQAALTAEIERYKSETQALQTVESPENDNNQLDLYETRGLKRKASPPSPMRLGDASNGHNEHTMEGHLAHLATKICHDLGQIAPNETIHLCGLAPLKIMEDRPDEVLELAHSKLHTWPYREVPTCWRRLYEDASLAKAVQILRVRAGLLEEPMSKRRRIEDVDDQQQRAVDDDWMTEIVATLDSGISMSGAPGRAITFEAVFQQLENHIDSDDTVDVPTRWSIRPPSQLSTEHPIARGNSALSFERFQHHLDTKTTPMIMPGTMAHWPATQNWQDPSYFLRITLGGRRQVPIEIGKSYTHPDWSQKIMSMRDFMQTYVLPAEPKEIGYLAQHDLFAQIPALRADIAIPDYCHTTPPPPRDEAAGTSGLKSSPQLSEPMLNFWFGPGGTRTDLHTDPYHNVLCQVVGYKYVRLYPPSETPNLYPRGVDDKGINMDNTSQVDVSKHARTSSLLGNGKGYTDLDALRDARARFPKFEAAKYLEGVLGPGECLYVPMGWWHYVEGLSVGISVSFWWN